MKSYTLDILVCVLIGWGCCIRAKVWGPNTRDLLSQGLEADSSSACLWRDLCSWVVPGLLLAESSCGAEKNQGLWCLLL